MFSAMYQTILYKVGPLAQGEAIALIILLYAVAAVCIMAVWLALLCAFDARRVFSVLFFAQAGAYCAALGVCLTVVASAVLFDLITH